MLGLSRTANRASGRISEPITVPTALKSSDVDKNFNTTTDTNAVADGLATYYEDNALMNTS